MRICIVHNPNAGHTTDFTPVQQAVEARDDLTLVEPGTPDAFFDVVAQAAREGYDVIAAAGGDGTVHAVANALLALDGPPESRPALAVLPLGTGNDLARTLAVPLHAGEALALIGFGPRHVIEAIQVEPMEGVTCHAINMANGGFAGQIRDALTPELKARWGPLAYVRAAAATMPVMDAYTTRITFDDGEPETHTLYNLMVAVGRTAGGGQPAAPTANPEDGLLEIVMVHAGTAGDVAGLAARAMTGASVTENALVETRRARRVHVEADPPIRFAVDGEMKADTPVSFAVVPRALQVIVGEEYRADPA